MDKKLRLGMTFIPQITSFPPITLLILPVSVTHKQTVIKTRLEHNLSQPNILLDNLNGNTKSIQLLTY